MPIINPWIFYIVGLLNALNWSLLIIIVVIGLIAIFLAGIYFDEHQDEDFVKPIRKWIKVCITTVITSTILFVAIPSKETMYTMIIASHVTYENVDKATKVIQDGVDYITDKMNGDED